MSHISPLVSEQLTALINKGNTVRIIDQRHVQLSIYQLEYL